MRTTVFTVLFSVLSIVVLVVGARMVARSQPEDKQRS